MLNSLCRKLWGTALSDQILICDWYQIFCLERFTFRVFLLLQFGLHLSAMFIDFGVVQRIIRHLRTAIRSENAE